MTNILPISELNVDGDEPRIRDLALAERLGFERPRAIRQIIERNFDEIRAYGPLATQCGKSRGQGFTEYWLNEGQALVICALSRTPNAAQVRKMVIEVFMAWRRGQTVDVKAHHRKPPARAVRESKVDVLREIKRKILPDIQEMVLVFGRNPDAMANLIAHRLVDVEMARRELGNVVTGFMDHGSAARFLNYPVD